MQTTPLEVVAAIILRQGRILCMQRKPHRYTYISEKYEFPGGKVEEDETLEQALRREIREELDMDIHIEAPLLTITHHYPDFALRMHTYVCHCQQEEPALHAHIAYRWATPGELLDMDWAAADLPIVERLLQAPL